MLLKKLKKVWRNPRMLVRVLLDSKLSRLLTDKGHVKLAYWAGTGKKLHLKNILSPSGGRKSRFWAWVSAINPS